jgi:hypothetical protein
VEEVAGGELPLLGEAEVGEDLLLLLEEEAGQGIVSIGANIQEMKFNWCKYAWSNECYALCQRYDASVECHASVECYASGSNG